MRIDRWMGVLVVGGVSLVACTPEAEVNGEPGGSTGEELPQNTSSDPTPDVDNDADLPAEDTAPPTAEDTAEAVDTAASQDTAAPQEELECSEDPNPYDPCGCACCWATDCDNTDEDCCGGFCDLGNDSLGCCGL